MGGKKPNNVYVTYFLTVEHKTKERETNRSDV